MPWSFAQRARACLTTLSAPDTLEECWAWAAAPQTSPPSGGRARAEPLLWIKTEVFRLGPDDLGQKELASPPMSDGKSGAPIWVWVAVPIGGLLLVLAVLAPLALYGVRKYMTNAKRAEGTAALVAWGDGLVRCGESDKLPPSSTPVPSNFSAVAGKKYQSAPTEWSELGHTCARFSMTGPQYFQYVWELTSATAGTLHARADFDGDGLDDASLTLQVRCDNGKCQHEAPTDASGDAMPTDQPGAHGSGESRGTGSPRASTAFALPTRPAVTAVPIPALDGAAVDLSTVMGRARKLANAWQPEASLLGVEANLIGGKIPTQEGGVAKVTFGPSPFASEQPRSGLFVVVYDKSGISGAPAKGTPGKPLAEPMCAPEGVWTRLDDFKDTLITLRYGLDGSQRLAWLVSLPGAPKPLRAFAPDDCSPRGTFVARPKH